MGCLALRVFVLVMMQQTAGAIPPEAIFHDPNDIFYVNPQVGELRLRVARDNIEQAFAASGARVVKMDVGHRDKDFEYYVASMGVFDSTLAYKFIVTRGTDTLSIPDQNYFRPLARTMKIPEWAAGRTYYYITVDGFSNGDALNDPERTNEWGRPPSNWLPYGGDLKGIIERSAYLDSLGPDIIILSPIFTAASNHKLNPRDFATIDAAYGDTNDLKRLIEEVHSMRKKIVLHIVVTHTGNDFPAFIDITSKQGASGYADWYRILSMPSQPGGFKYRAWRSDMRFPLLNLRNRQLQDYLIDFIDYWARFGFDGFYFGESEEIDGNFMGRLYEHVRARYPDLLIISTDRRLPRTNGADACYDRQFTRDLRAYFVDNTLTTAAFDSIINRMLFFNPAQVNRVNLIGLHDHDQRIAYAVDDRVLELMYAFVFTYCGSPMLLCGDEVGMQTSAPLNWGSFPWNAREQNRRLLHRLRGLIRMRRESRHLTGRHFFTLYTDDIKKVYAYDRGGVITVLNCNPAQVFVKLPAWDGTYLDLMSGEKYIAYAQTLKLSVDALSYRILKREI
ncbi:alpha amylase N-terminal ig-like domain-containing protein [candidate division WOR-3 bacterium]|nr:alpha amylase N-terminal ig-like domain-containing protein [candidate division WOR-3 bacterium]